MADAVCPISERATAWRTELIREPQRWDAIRAPWQALHQAAQGRWATEFDWLRTWWEVYGGVCAQRHKSLMLLALWEGDQLVAAAPLYVRRPRLSDAGRVVMFIGTGEREREEVCPDYLDVLCRRDRPQATAVLLDWLLRERVNEFDRLELNDVAQDSLAAQWGRQRLSDAAMEVAPRGNCPIADLSGGMEAYLARLSANERSQARRRLKEAKALGATLEMAGPESVDQYFDELVELHQSRWRAAGRPGCFASRRFTDFHRRLARQWLGEGKALLSRLRLDGKTIAVKYGFLYYNKYDFYQSGVRLEGEQRLRSPGTVSFLMLFEELIRRGVTRFDFLRGDSNYKQRLATSAQSLAQVRWTRWSWRTNVACASRFLHRGSMKVAHLLRRRRLGEG